MKRGENLTQRGVGRNSLTRKAALIWAFIAVQSPNRVQLFVTPWPTACQVSLSFTISQGLLKAVSIGSTKEQMTKWHQMSERFTGVGSRRA